VEEKLPAVAAPNPQRTAQRRRFRIWFRDTSRQVGHEHRAVGHLSRFEILKRDARSASWGQCVERRCGIVTAPRLPNSRKSGANRAPRLSSDSDADGIASRSSRTRSSAAIFSLSIPTAVLLAPHASEIVVAAGGHLASLVIIYIHRIAPSKKTLLVVLDVAHWMGEKADLALEKSIARVCGVPKNPFFGSRSRVQYGRVTALSF
jgi:hypothetical protein